MKLNKKLAYGGATAALAVALLAGGGAVAVQAAANTTATGPAGLVTKIAMKHALRTSKSVKLACKNG